MGTGKGKQEKTKEKEKQAYKINQEATDLKPKIHFFLATCVSVEISTRMKPTQAKWPHLRVS